MVILINDSYVIFDNVSLGDYTHIPYIVLMNQSTLVIKDSRLRSFEIGVTDNSTLIILNSSIEAGEANYHIIADGTSHVEMINVNADMGGPITIENHGYSNLIIDNFTGNIYISARNFSFVQIENIDALDFRVELYDEAYGTFNNVFNQTTSSTLNFTLSGSSSVHVINASYVNYFNLYDASHADIVSSNISEVNIENFEHYQRDGAWAVINGSTINAIYAKSPRITEIYNSTINWAYELTVINNTYAILNGSELIRGTTYSSLKIVNSILHNPIQNLNELWYLICSINSTVLINNSAYLEDSLFIDSAIEVNDSSFLQKAHLYNTVLSIHNGSAVSILNAYEGSNVTIGDIGVPGEGNLSAHAYDSSLIIDGLNTSGWMADLSIYLSNSSLLINNSDFYHLGTLNITGLEFSSIKIENSIIRNAPSTGNGFSVNLSSAEEFILYNTIISKDSAPSIWAYATKIINITSSEIYANQTEYGEIYLWETDLFIKDSIFNITIVNIGELHSGNITIINSFNGSLNLIIGNAKIYNSSLYELYVWDRAELYNVTILSKLLYRIRVDSGELNITNGYYSGTNVEASVFMDPLVNLSQADVIINALLAYNSNVLINHVYAVEFLNITKSDVEINDTTIRIVVAEEWLLGSMLIFYSNVTLNNCTMRDMFPIPILNSTVTINQSDLYADLYTYFSNITINNSYVENVYTGFLPGTAILFNDIGKITVNGSTLDNLYIVTAGDHRISYSQINYLVVVINDIIVNSSTINTLGETYYWYTDGSVINGIPTGYFKRVSIIQDFETIVFKRDLIAYVYNGTVSIENSTLFAVTAVDTGKIIAKNTSIIKDARVMGFGNITLINCTFIDDNSSISLYEYGYMKLENISGLSNIYATELSTLSVSNTSLVDVYVMGNTTFNGINLIIENLYIWNYSVVELNYTEIINNFVVIGAVQLEFYSSNVTMYLSLTAQASAFIKNSNISDIIVTEAKATINYSEVNYIEAFLDASLNISASTVFEIYMIENSTGFIINSIIGKVYLEDGEITLYNTTYINGYSIETING